MKLTEIKKDLFDMPEEYHLAHCISSDAAMGAGIAVLFKKKFNLSILIKLAKQNELEIGTCRRVDKILNLITKKNYWNKPTYDSLTNAIVSMKQVCLSEGINKIAMPEIGCGLDKLQWSKVKEIILDIFSDTEMEIIVCRIN
ncbi:hypothetical protein EHS13_14415 [Paenibacillus psychroresistens]|uniref:Macro domain-containing protein n=1 Tax=Paenibacillus psychroresistens TaxID=1778678 RepID=A0A6B8RKA6_9BACL|nr:macro domain-containing protein [Paenibacillus psychroresistens]QGQ95983.1 hypothetical protein EHS13_14415 [Paenibacillus psychroresistens]